MYTIRLSFKYLRHFLSPCMLFAALLISSGALAKYLSARPCSVNCPQFSDLTCTANRDCLYVCVVHISYKVFLLMGILLRNLFTRVIVSRRLRVASISLIDIGVGHFLPCVRVSSRPETPRACVRIRYSLAIIVWLLFQFLYQVTARARISFPSQPRWQLCPRSVEGTISGIP